MSEYIPIKVDKNMSGITIDCVWIFHQHTQGINAIVKSILYARKALFLTLYWHLKGSLATLTNNLNVSFISMPPVPCLST